MENKCLNCKNNYKPKDCEPRCNCMCENYNMFEPITNYDRIKSMSVEEMAELIDKNYKCRKCAYYHKCCNGDCTNGIIQWLLQEVSENDR